MAVKIQSGTTLGNLAAPVQSAATTSLTGGTGLTAATAYFYKVTALTAQGETVGSNEQTVTTGAGTTNSNTVSWVAVVGATSYRVYRGTATNAENVFYAPGNVTSYVDTGAATTAGSPPATGTAVGLTTVTFALHYSAVQVINRGGGDIFYTVDGTNPTVGGADNYVATANQTVTATIPPAEPALAPASATVVKLISANTVAFTVEGD